MAQLCSWIQCSSACYFPGLGIPSTHFIMTSFFFLIFNRMEYTKIFKQFSGLFFIYLSIFIFLLLIFFIILSIFPSPFYYFRSFKSSHGLKCEVKIEEDTVVESENLQTEIIEDKEDFGRKNMRNESWNPSFYGSFIVSLIWNYYFNLYFSWTSKVKKIRLF